MLPSYYEIYWYLARGLCKFACCIFSKLKPKNKQTNKQTNKQKKKKKKHHTQKLRVQIRMLIFGFSCQAILKSCSVVARAFPGGQPAHPGPQIEEENEEKLRKDERKSRRMRKN